MNEIAQKIITDIKLSRMESDFIDIGPILEDLDIYEFIQQPDDNIRLTFCYYLSWICTDTEVGIRVWYLDNLPVCISYKKYRKSDESFYWQSEAAYKDVLTYIRSLELLELDVTTMVDMPNLIKESESVEFKQHEDKNYTHNKTN